MQRDHKGSCPLPIEPRAWRGAPQSDRLRLLARCFLLPCEFLKACLALDCLNGHLDNAAGGALSLYGFALLMTQKGSIFL